MYIIVKGILLSIAPISTQKSTLSAESRNALGGDRAKKSGKWFVSIWVPSEFWGFLDVNIPKYKSDQIFGPLIPESEWVIQIEQNIKISVAWKKWLFIYDFLYS